METLSQHALMDMARASSASGKILEAHADAHDRICRVVIAMHDGLRNMQLREAILQLWMSDGFIASASRDGVHLFIDGRIDGHNSAAPLDLVAQVAHQMKRYTQRAMHDQAARELGSGNIALMAHTLAQSGECRLSH